MGYTHYWKKEGKINETEYAKAFKDCVKIVETVSKKTKIGNAIDFQYIKLGNGSGDNDTHPEVSDLGLYFNGIENEAHETFAIPAKGHQLEEFQFCKTQRKPYDSVVTACLARLAQVKGVVVSSDGDESDWKPGLDLANKILGVELKFPVAEE